MKASEYRAQLRAAYEAGRQALDFETCVELCVLGDLLPEVREKAKWQIEYEFAMNWFQRNGNGLDARFVRALNLELDDARLFVAANGKLPPWAVEMAERRYFVEAEGRTETPRQDGDGEEGEILRSEGGLGAGTGKDRPEGRGANCNGVATGLRGGSTPGDERRVTSDERGEA